MNLKPVETLVSTYRSILRRNEFPWIIKPLLFEYGHSLRLGYRIWIYFGTETASQAMKALQAVAIWDRYFSDLPTYILLSSILLVGLASPVAFMLDNYKSARIYEAAISGGQFFLVAGFLAAITALSLPIRSWRLALAGSLWALAIGTRLILVLPVGFMVLMVAWSILRANHRSFEKVTLLIPLGCRSCLVLQV